MLIEMDQDEAERRFGKIPTPQETLAFLEKLEDDYNKRGVWPTESLMILLYCYRRIVKTEAA